MAMDKKTQFNFWYIVVAFAGVLLLQYFLGTYQQQVATIDYSQFQSYLKDGKIDKITISENYIRGRIKDPAPDQPGEFITHRVDQYVAEDLSKYGVSYKGTTESTLLRDLLSWIVPMLVFFGIWMFVFRRIADKQGLGGGFMSIGKSKAKVYVEHDTKVTFADVAGVDEAEAELQEIVDFLKDPKRYSR
ncbi:MAG TPA: ATP-dependent metallopeptidase FtsH/Yme1/Tma family protein, partial [Dongiaceae bacterium]